MRSTKREKESIRAYVEDQAHEEVVHLEKAASELVGPVRHDIWDVHCALSRWWGALVKLSGNHPSELTTDQATDTSSPGSSGRSTSAGM